MRNVPALSLVLISYMCGCADQQTEPSGTAPGLQVSKGQPVNSEVMFASYPIGQLSANPCCIYHYTGVPVATFEQQLSTFDS